MNGRKAGRDAAPRYLVGVVRKTPRGPTFHHREDQVFVCNGRSVTFAHSNNERVEKGVTFFPSTCPCAGPDSEAKSLALKTAVKMTSKDFILILCHV